MIGGVLSVGRGHLPGADGERALVPDLPSESRRFAVDVSGLVDGAVNGTHLPIDLMGAHVVPSSHVAEPNSASAIESSDS